MKSNTDSFTDSHNDSPEPVCQVLLERYFDEGEISFETISLPINNPFGTGKRKY